MSVDTDAFGCLKNVGDALRYVTYLLFVLLHCLILDYDPYVQCKGWDELIKYVVESENLPQIFAALYSSEVELLGVD